MIDWNLIYTIGCHVLLAVATFLYARSRAIRHAKLIEEDNKWMGHGRTHEGKEIVLVGLILMNCFYPLYGVFLVFLLGNSFDIILNKTRGKSYNYLGVIEDRLPDFKWTSKDVLPIGMYIETPNRNTGIILDRYKREDGSYTYKVQPKSIGKEDALFDIVQYKLLAPYHMIIRLVLMVAVLAGHVWITFL